MLLIAAACGERDISRQFGERQLRSLNCAKKLPHHEYSVTLVFQKTVKAIDYGYKDPSTGKHLDTSEIMAALPDSRNVTALRRL